MRYLKNRNTHYYAGSDFHYVTPIDEQNLSASRTTNQPILIDLTLKKVLQHSELNYRQTKGASLNQSLVSKFLTPLPAALISLEQSFRQNC